LGPSKKGEIPNEDRYEPTIKVDYLSSTLTSAFWFSSDKIDMDMRLVHFTGTLSRTMAPYFPRNHTAEGETAVMDAAMMSKT